MGQSRLTAATMSTASTSTGSTFGHAFRLVINGKLVESQDYFDVINPSSGKPFARAPRATPEHLEQAIQSAAAAFKTWSVTPIETRREALRKCAEAIKANSDILAKVLVQEQGKALAAAKGEISGVVGATLLTAKFNIPVEKIHEDANTITEVHRKPIGVVAGITPWNFPALMAINKIAPAIFTGNTIVLKPSPYTPLTSLMLGELFCQFFPPGVVNVLSGDDSLGKDLVAHPSVSKVSFTGSINTGKAIMRSSADHLKRVTLELGGNDAAIVRGDVANIPDVARKILGRAMINSGQVCAAIKRVYVHESKYDEFVKSIAEAATNSATMKFGNGLEPGVTHGPVNNLAQLKKIREMVDDAKRNGARVVCGGSEDSSAGGYFFPATVIADVDDSARVVAEEQFGPVLPILRYSSDDEAIARANNTPYGLSGSVWTQDVAIGHAMALQLECGTTWVNDHLNSPPTAPFGGRKWSGIGRENGEQSMLQSFTEAQVLRFPKQNAAAATKAKL
eukprot:c12179_g1_i1.p1 GENE.c12179_g1_i1~~c12179_g1_i1.p1  ORF type:complete len:508 (-),score=141.78 c12179_g1_i1:311-1834(-)